jgi:hypothetical protein
MALEEFERQEPNNRDKRYIQMRSIMDYGMGVLLTALGVYFLFSTNISPAITRFDTPWIKGLGGITVLYGIFRIYRGYKKNYLRER